MKILNLLEGSENLFHITPGHNMMQIINSGHIQLSNLMIDKSEREKVNQKLKIDDDSLYYLSFARSLASSYMKQVISINLNHVAIMEFSGHKLSKYGRIKPIKFHDASRSNGLDEMEDRLISNTPHLPISLIKTLYVVCPDKFIHVYQQLNQITNVPVIVFQTTNDLLHRKNGTPVNDLTPQDSHPYTIDDKSKDFDEMVDYIKFTIDFLQEKPQTHQEFDEIKFISATVSIPRMLEKIRPFDPALVHKFKSALQKSNHKHSILTLRTEMRKHFQNLKDAEQDDELLNKLIS